MFDERYLIPFLICTATAVQAYRKGYNPALWFFAGGPIGLLAMIFFPNTNDTNRNETENTRLRKRGDKFAIAIVSIVVLFLIGAWAKLI